MSEIKWVLWLWHKFQSKYRNLNDLKTIFLFLLKTRKENLYFLHCNRYRVQQIYSQNRMFSSLRWTMNDSMLQAAHDCSCDLPRHASPQTKRCITTKNHSLIPRIPIAKTREPLFSSNSCFLNIFIFALSTVFSLIFKH